MTRRPRTGSLDAIKAAWLKRTAGSCLMPGDMDVQSAHQGKTYYFRAKGEKEFFDQYTEVFDRFQAEGAARTAKPKK